VAIYANAGDIINYTYLVTNTGPDTLDPGVTSVLDDQELVTCPLAAPLAPTASVTCTAQHVITQQDINNTTLTNIAQAMVDDVESNTATVTVTSRSLLQPIMVPTLSWQGLLSMILLMLFGYRWHLRSSY